MLFIDRPLTSCLDAESWLLKAAAYFQNTTNYMILLDSSFSASGLLNVRGQGSDSSLEQAAPNDMHYRKVAVVHYR